MDSSIKYVKELYQNALKIKEELHLPDSELNNIIAWIVTAQNTQIGKMVQMAFKEEAKSSKGSIKLNEL